MAVHHLTVRPPRVLRAALLGGVSALVFLGHGMPAYARPLNGGATVSATVTAAASAITSAQQAASATEQSMNSLSRAAQAIQAMQAAQAAARNQALSAPGGVPNGLVAGGLTPDSGLAGAGVANTVTTWTNAATPTQTTTGGQTVVTVKQTAQKAILNWSSFNIGGDTELYVNQSAGNSSTGNGWIALNRVADPSGAPSQILGQIKAEGSVYLIDANGVIFGGSSQINVSSLIASSLNLFSNNLAASNSRFLAGGIGDLDTANFATDSILLTSATPGAGNIAIAAGASITLGGAGLAVIAAPNVTNNGAITAPSGQVALIAGVGVSYDYNYSSLNSYGPDGSAGHPQGYNDNSTSFLRFANYGELTDANGADITPVGALVNNGLIYTPRGNITLLGGAVQQNGVAVATTSVAQPGSIVVQSLYEVGAHGAHIPSSSTPDPADESDATFYTGAIAFGPQAVTAILPDVNGVTLPSDQKSLAPFKTPLGGASFTTPLPTQGFGLIEIIGQAIDFQGGSLAYAPGQTIAASTVVLVDPRTSAPAVPGSGRILLESGATLDVSGIPNTELATAANLLTVSLGGNELADSPLQQDGGLYGASVTVDMRLSGANSETGESWVGTPLANLSSYANLRQNSIDQLLVNGGAVSLNANEFVGAPGSTINLMGGYLHYLGGMVQTTELIGANGGLYNIGSANPNVVYVGIAGQFTVDHAHWGVKEIYIDPLIGRGYYEPDYIQGGDAGTLSIGVGGGNGAAANTTVANSGAVILDSTVLAGAVAGARQVGAGTAPSDGTFDFLGIESIEIGDPSALSAQSLAASSAPANFTMASPLLASAGSAYAAANVFNSQILNDADFKNINLATVTTTTTPSTTPFTSITEDAGTTLAVQPGGTISLTSGGVAINGDLTARAGGISIATQMRGDAPNDIVIASSAALDVSGLFFNESLWSPAEAQGVTALVNGGSISLATGVAVTAAALDLTGDITLAAGSLLNLEGGGIVLANGQLKTGGSGAPVGSGGNLTLETYQGVGTPPIPGAVPSRGVVTLDGAIDALGFSGGGALTLQAVAFQIGGDVATTPSYAFYFDPTFWGDRGFDSFKLNSVLQSEVPAGAIVRLTHENLLPDYPAIGSAPSGADPAAYATVGFLTGTLLSPTNLNVTAGIEEFDNYYGILAGGADYAQVDLGAQILADPGASISFTSWGMTNILGGISAQGGTIALAVNWATVGNGVGGALGPLYLGPQSVLDVSGAAVVNPLTTPVATLGGLVVPYAGEILAGGAISLTDAFSPILAAPGAVLNVSGAAGAFDVAQLAAGGHLGGASEVLSRQPVWSNAGQVNLTDGAGMLFEGALIGNPGAAQAAGATLQITASSTAYASANLYLVQDTAAAVAASGAVFNLATYAPAIQGYSAFTLDPKIPNGSVLFGVDSLAGSGFSSLIVNSASSLDFAGQVSLTLSNSFIANAPTIVAYNAGNFTGQLPSWSNPTTYGASLSVTAPYIAITGASAGGNGGLPSPPSPAPQTADASMTLSASQLDLSAFIYLENIGQATFISMGDIRLLPASYAPLHGTQLPGLLLTTGNLTFEAADVYPATDTAFVIEATQSYSSSPLTTVTFEYPSGVGPSTAPPLSAAGTLLVDADTIVQDGEIQAPFGSIILGVTGTRSTLFSAISNALGGYNPPFIYSPAVSAQTVTLGDGSITSVSANGATIPFGSTVDQTTWIYNPQLNNPTWNGGGQTTNPFTAAPQGAVTLAGNAVNFDSGAVVDLEGGGNLYAQEWVPGAGGSRNALLQYQTSYQNSTAGQQIPTYPDARQIFAIVPGFTGAVAPYDANLSQSGLTAGESVYLAGGDGLPAGVYTLLPAQYATLPGAYRVVVNSGVANPLVSQTVTLADGTMAMTGYLTNTFAGGRPSATEQFYVQSAATWGRYSQYALNSAATFFPSYAAKNSLATPYVPADAGRLAFEAVSGLTVNGAVEGAAAAGGVGAQVDISSQYIEIVGAGETVQPGYLAISADALDNLGVASLLIGGLRSETSAGMAIAPTANGVIVATDAKDPLQAPEIMLVATPLLQTKTIQLDAEDDTATVSIPQAGSGQVLIQSDSVVEAQGTVGPGEATTLILGGALSTLPTLPTSLSVSLIEETTSGYTSPATVLANYYAALDTALGALVRVSNGSPVTVQLPSVVELNPGAISVTDNVNTSNSVYRAALPSLASVTGAVVQSGAQLLGGNALTLASTGNAQIQSGALLSGANIYANSDQIAFVGSGAPPSGGSVINPATLIQLQNAETVDLQSSGVIAFQGNVTLQMTGGDGQGALTLGGGALTSDGGQISISAPTLVLDNELSAATPTFAAGTGTLAIDVGELIFGVGAKTLTGFGGVSLVANRGVVGQGSGSMNFGSLPVTLRTPIVIAAASSDQAIATTGALSVAPIAGGAAMTSSALGGAITLQGGTVTASIPIQALAGNISVKASAGDVTVTGGGALIAHGVAKQFVDLSEYADAGAITLSANQGTVNIQSGAVVDFSGAAGGGDGGSLSIVTANSTAPVALNGTLCGATAAGYNGSRFNLNASGAVALDSLAQILTSAGVTGGVAVESSQGNLSLSKTLTASEVSLIADGGAVTVAGAIVVNGTATKVGEINLYGTNGVDVEGALTATGSPNSQQPGGLINIGTTGTGSTTSLNAAYGYENVDPSASGAITIGAAAAIDASGGTVTLRAPILDTDTVNITIKSGAQIRGGRLWLDAYAVWSTADQGAKPNQHFDGIVDPAGWYNSNGALQAGAFVNASGTAVAAWNGGTLTNDDGTTNSLSYYLANDYFTPNTYYASHVVFYGGYDPNTESFNPSSPDVGSLPHFVQHGLDGFSGVANFQARPEIDLVNPSPAQGGVNGGAISVLTNWNLGAGVINSDGSLTLAYRYENTIAPIITLRAAGDVKVDASISDGFFQTASVLPPWIPTYTSVLAEYNSTLANLGQLGATVTSQTEIQFFDGTNASSELLGAQDPNFALAAPQSSGSVLYYQNYQTYASQLYRLWAVYLSFDNGTFFPVTASTGVPPAPPLAADPSYASDYQTYLANYANWLETYVTPTTFETYTSSTTAVAITPPAPSAPLNPQSYATYATAYSNYYNYVNNDLVDHSLGPSGLVDWTYAPAAPGFIASGPTLPPSNLPSNMPTASDVLPVQFAALAAGRSASYVIVAGANIASANPLALANAATLVKTGALPGEGNVTLDGDTLVAVNGTDYVIAAPTTIRTGDGSIDIAAAENFELLDAIAPGVVYTAGVPVQPSANGDGASIALGQGAFKSANSVYDYGISTVLTPAVNTEGGGNISLTVGADIIGIENVTDTLATSGTSPSGLTSNPGAFVGQLWEPWLLTCPNAASVPWYVNFGSFDQGLMSIGGNVTVSAGGSISDLAVSLPTTAYLDSSNTLHITGGGDLTVIAGGGIGSGDFYVGQGAGLIKSGGAIAPDFNYAPLDDSHLYPVATLLAVQYGAIAVEAREAVNIGGVYDPTYLWAPNMGDVTNPPVASYTSAISTAVDLIPYVTSMSATSGVSVQSTAGSVTFNSFLAEGDMIAMGSNTSGAPGTYVPAPAAFVSSLLLPASLDLVALQGGITIDYGGGLYPSAAGALSIIADQSIQLALSLTTEFDESAPPIFTDVGNVFGTSLGKLDYPVGTGILPTASAPALLSVWDLPATLTNDPGLILKTPSDLVHIYALNGSLIDGLQVTASDGSIATSGSLLGVAVGEAIDQISLIPNAPAQIYAGRNITDLPFFGTNFTAADITSIIAGGDIGYSIFGDKQSPTIELAGPGALDVVAGGNISFESQRLAGVTETGVRTLGNSIDTAADPIFNSPAPIAPATYITDFGNPYLSIGGTSVNVLFGVGPGMNTGGFIAAYINPTTAGAASYASDLVSFVSQYEGEVGTPVSGSLTPAQAWKIFETLPANQQQLLVEEVFFDILNTTGLNYNDPSSSTYKQYVAGYQAINTLFPAVYGYTQNVLTGVTNGANQLISTGTLDLRGSTVQTQQGGDISILGAGGRILVGSSGAAPAVNPASEGILTLESGNIDIFADQSVLVAQSRIMTEQGGGIVMWSSNGDLDAGEGAKTSVSAPPPLYACDIDFHCSADIKGQVSGAGIATLQSLPGVPVGDANLMAPRGTVNAGAAGIRATGNLNIAALFVANAFNIQVGGAAIGVAAPPPNIGALTTASNQAGASAQQATAPTQSQNNDRPSIIMVEILGFGGGDGTPRQQPQEEDRRQKKTNDQRSYNPNSAFQIVGVGALTDDQKQQLTRSEQRELDGQ